MLPTVLLGKVRYRNFMRVAACHAMQPQSSRWLKQGYRIEAIAFIVVDTVSYSSFRHRLTVLLTWNRRSARLKNFIGVQVGKTQGFTVSRTSKGSRP